MKILLLSGSHPRHSFLHSIALNHASDVAAIVMQRESTMPDCPGYATSHDADLFYRHFNERKSIEDTIFGTQSPSDLFSNINTFKCSPTTLNSNATAEFASSFDADLAFVFGTDIIKAPLLNVLPENTINLHLGLSPWYRGSATLFWPFYFLQPQFCGATFHKIVLQADAGAILHQFSTRLEFGDGIHDVGVRTVIQARKALDTLLGSFVSHKWSYVPQKTSGRLYLTRDFQPAHLRIIYDVFDNDIVDAYLNLQLDQKLPILSSSLYN